MPKKLESCKNKVMTKGKTESEAYAICAKSTGWVHGKGGKWVKKPQSQIGKKSKTKLNESVFYKIDKLLEETQNLSFSKGIYVDVKPDPGSVEKIWRYL